MNSKSKLMSFVVVMVAVAMSAMSSRAAKSKTAIRDKSESNEIVPPKSSSTATSEAYCDLELNCKGDMSEMPTSMKLPIRGAKGPPGPPGEKGEPGEDGANGLPGMPGLTAPLPKKVAFFAGLQDHVGPVEAHTVLVFDRVVTNVGGGFDPPSGKFRAPINGTYQFSVVVSAKGRHKAAVMLVKNGGLVATVWAESIPLWATSSNTVILNLDKDDQIWLLVLHKASNLHGYMYTTFSGFLIFEN